MRYFLLIFLALNLWSLDFEKQIVKLENQQGLTSVLLDEDIYRHSRSDFGDLRLYNNKSEEIEFLIKEDSDTLFKSHSKHLTPVAYYRNDQKVIFETGEPFDFSRIFLSLNSKNFEALIDLYLDEKLVRENISIYDYSQEARLSKTYINIKDRARHVAVVFKKVKILQGPLKGDLSISNYDKTIKLKNILLNKRLNIVGLTLIGSKKKNIYAQRIVKPLSAIDSNETSLRSSYIFKTDNVKLGTISIYSNGLFSRSVSISHSNSGLYWTPYKSQHISSKNNEINLSGLRNKYLKVEVNNLNKITFKAESFEYSYKADYLYFQNNPLLQYRLTFGNQSLKRRDYDLKDFIDFKNVKNHNEFGPLITLEDQNLQKSLSISDSYKSLIFTFIAILSIIILFFIAIKMFKEEPL